MAHAVGMSRAKVILLAIELIVDNNLAGLRSLIRVHPRTLYLDLVLRMLLTALPESTSPNTYTRFLQELVKGFPEDGEAALFEIKDTAVEDITEDEARLRVRSLHLLPLLYSPALSEKTTDPLTLFLIHRAHRIDMQTGVLTLLPELIVPFLDQSEALRNWFISNLLPLLRLDYEFYPGQGGNMSLLEFRALDGLSGVDLLLSRTGDDRVGRDLRGLVGPWMYKASGSTSWPQDSEPSSNPEFPVAINSGVESSEALGGRGWSDVSDWVLANGSTNFPLAVKAVEQWDGPGDVDLGGYGAEGVVYEGVEEAGPRLAFLRAALGAIYLTTDDTIETFTGACSILARVATMLDIEPPAELSRSASFLPNTEILRSTMTEASMASLLPNLLTRPQNPLTTPSKSSIDYLHRVLLSAYLLTRLGHKISIQGIVTLSLFANGESQRRELQRVLHNSLHRSKQSDQDWLRLHEEIVWMWKWGTDMRSPGEGAAHSIGVFFKLSRSTIEREFLKALLDNARYDLAIQTHLHTPHKASLLSRDEVEKAVLETTLAFYDQASNGNRTRGGMKKASEIVNAFRGEFESSAPLHRVEKLLEATHALSFYSLTLSHGLPFQPVNIRVHQDPIALLGKVLEQNARSYSKLDDLLMIGRNFLDAGLLNPKQDGGFRDITPAEQERLVARTQSRITGMAIEAALTEDDFDTAYSYVMNRIAQGMQQTSDLSAIEDASTDHDDTTSWRAAFQAGRYRPMKLLQRSSTSLTKTANADLRIQEMRMELLAQALLVAPAAALPEILGVWRRCEEELNALLAQETEAEEQWDDQGDQKIPGQFMSAPATKVRRDASGRGTGDEAPVGLFDVARGAAAALSKTAFPLRSAGSGGTSRGSGSGGGEDAVGRELNEEGRVRKRDVVSNIVTGGLASGIGWVLGATPAPAQDME